MQKLAQSTGHTSRKCLIYLSVVKEGCNRQFNCTVQPFLTFIVFSKSDCEELLCLSYFIEKESSLYSTDVSCNSMCIEFVCSLLSIKAWADEGQSFAYFCLSQSQSLTIIRKLSVRRVRYGGLKY